MITMKTSYCSILKILLPPILSHKCRRVVHISRTSVLGSVHFSLVGRHCPNYMQCMQKSVQFAHFSMRNNNVKFCDIWYNYNCNRGITWHHNQQSPTYIHVLIAKKNLAVCEITYTENVLIYSSFY